MKGTTKDKIFTLVMTIPFVLVGVILILISITNLADKGSLLLFLFGLAFLGAAVILVIFHGETYIKLGSDETKLSGEFINANIIDIVENVDGTFSVICEWYNVFDKKTYKFKSDALNDNPTDYIKNNNIKTLKVYVNSKNINIYKVDTNYLTLKDTNLFAIEGKSNTIYEVPNKEVKKSYKEERKVLFKKNDFKSKLIISFILTFIIVIIIYLSDLYKIFYQNINVDYGVVLILVFLLFVDVLVICEFICEMVIPPKVDILKYRGNGYFINKKNRSFHNIYNKPYKEGTYYKVVRTFSNVLDVLCEINENEFIVKESNKPLYFMIALILLVSLFSSLYDIGTSIVLFAIVCLLLYKFIKKNLSKKNNIETLKDVVSSVVINNNEPINNVEPIQENKVISHEKIYKVENALSKAIYIYALIGMILYTIFGFIWIGLSIFLLYKGLQSDSKIAAIIFGSVFILVGIYVIYNGITGILTGLKESSNDTNNIIDNYITARYIDTIETSNHFFYILCEWVNPIDNKTYQFKSRSLLKNPKEYITSNNIKDIKVYIDIKNLKKYTVDTSFLEE